MSAALSKSIASETRRPLGRASSTPLASSTRGRELVESEERTSTKLLGAMTGPARERRSSAARATIQCSASGEDVDRDAGALGDLLEGQALGSPKLEPAAYLDDGCCLDMRAIVARSTAVSRWASRDGD